MFSDPKFKANPYPYYAQARDSGPAQKAKLPNGVKVCLVGRYDDVQASLKDARLIKNIHDARKMGLLARLGLNGLANNSSMLRAGGRASSRNCRWTCRRANMSDKIQVVIADDHPLFRDGLIQTLKAEPDSEIVGQATTASAAVSLVAELVPDVVLLDITIPGSGLKAATLIAATSPITKMIMLTASEAEEDVLMALKAGARGYILKGVSGPDLVNIGRDVHR